MPLGPPLAVSYEPPTLLYYGTAVLLLFEAEIALEGWPSLRPTRGYDDFEAFFARARANCRVVNMSGINHCGMSLQNKCESLKAHCRWLDLKNYSGVFHPFNLLFVTVYGAFKG